MLLFLVKDSQRQMYVENKTYFSRQIARDSYVAIQRVGSTKIARIIGRQQEIAMTYFSRQIARDSCVGFSPCWLQDSKRQQELQVDSKRQQGLTFPDRQQGIPVCAFHCVVSKIAKDSKSYSQIARDSKALLFQIDRKGHLCGLITVWAPRQQKIAKVA